MQLIRKKICLESLRTRTPGLVPYIPFNSAVTEGTIVSASSYNGNWGQFVYNFVDDSGVTVNYLSMMNDYFTIREILNNGVKLKAIKKGREIYYTDNFDDEPALYDYVPHIISDFTYDEYGLYHNSTVNDPYINLIEAEDYQNYTDLGGIEQCKKVEEYIGIYVIPSAITGDMVPYFMYYSEIPEWEDWFAMNEAKSNGGDINWYYYYNPQSKMYWTLTSPSDIAVEYSVSIYDNINGESHLYKCTSKVGDVFGFTSETMPALTLTYESYRSITVEKDCCIAQEWIDRGGYPMWELLRNRVSAVGQKLAWWNSRFDKLVKPTIDIPLLITQNTIDLGVFSPYDEEEAYTTARNYYIWINEDQSINEKVIYSIERNPENGILPGYYVLSAGSSPFHFSVIDTVERNGGAMKIKTSSVKSWYFYGGEITNNAEPDDDDELQSDSEITTESHIETLRRYERTYDDKGNLCPFYYDMDEDETDIVFATGEKFNLFYGDHEETYDAITSIKFYDEQGRVTTNRSQYDSVVFEYSLGMREGDGEGIIDRGIRYKETYPCSLARYTERVNGILGLEYVLIDFGSMSSTIYNRDFNLSREGNMATLMGMKTYDIWGDEEATTTAVYKEEFLDRVSEKPDIKVNVEVDRGNASAFERHLKLNEINTFADLENYGNNFFGL